MEHLRSLGAHVVGIVFNDSRRTPVHVARPVKSNRGVVEWVGHFLENVRALGARLRTQIRHTSRQGAVAIAPPQTIVPAPTADGGGGYDGSLSDSDKDTEGPLDARLVADTVQRS